MSAEIEQPALHEKPTSWIAVLALAVCAGTLVSSEFMPLSVLPLLATDLGLTEGQAGQATSASGCLAVLTALSLPSIARRWDWRPLLIGFVALTTVSAIVIALAPNYFVFIFGRALLGISIGGFWSMSTATVMRLVPLTSVPRALAMLHGGNALASTVVAPFGSMAADFVGWRGAHLAVVPLSALALYLMIRKLPSLPLIPRTTSHSFVQLLAHKQLMLGLSAIMLFFIGRFALFTYLRPFLEGVTGVDVPTLSILLLMVGLTGLLGLTSIGWVLSAGLYRPLISIPVILAVVALALVFAGSDLATTAALLAIWGLISTPAPVAWNTWLARTLPQNAYSAEAGH